MTEGVRLGAGRLKGRVLPVGPGVRPTGSRVREALFDVLGSRIEGARVLDLFAGSGALGLEALSRGAAEALLAEADAQVLRVLRRTALALGGRSARVVRLHLPRQLARLAAIVPSGFDVILADPPYRFDRHFDLLRGAAPLLAKGGVLVLEHPASEEMPVSAASLRRVDLRRYGESGLSFYEDSTTSSGGSQPRK